MPTPQTTPVDPHNLPYRKGVGICLFNKDGLVLCAERRDHRGAWQMPQGGTNLGEDLEHAVFREMQEEIGTNNAEIITRIEEPLRYEFPDYMQYRNGVFHGKYRGQEQVWYALRYLGKDEEIDLSHNAEPELPEFINWRWAKLETLPPLIVEFKRPMYDRIVKEFAPIGK